MNLVLIKSLEKLTHHLHFKHYFTRHKSKRVNFKFHLTLSFCKIYASRINFGLNNLRIAVEKLLENIDFFKV